MQMPLESVDGARRRRLIQAAAVGAALPAAALLGRSAAAVTSGHALLVGNEAYRPSDENIGPARKCITDLGAQLQRFGFSVTTLFEPTLDQVRGGIDQLRRAVAADDRLPALFYFVGHGFQSNAENLLVPAGGNLDAKPEELARASLSLERDVFSRLTRPLGPAATVILVDACRTPDRPLKPPEGLNQTLPPEGCHVAFATGPGKRAFAPQDPNQYTLFAEMLVAELASARPTGSVASSLERVRSRVLRRVNGIDVIVKLFGRDAQSPELASNVTGDPIWIGAAPAPAPLADPPAVPAVAASTASPGPSAPAGAPSEVDMARASEELEAIAALTSPEDAYRRLKALADKLPDGDVADLVKLRLRDLERVLGAARTARLNPDLGVLQGQPPKVIEDAQRALRGDKYAAMRVAEALSPPGSGELIERTDHGRWMSFSAHLGNGIAAWQLSLHFRNVDRRDAEAARYANLARANNYIPPRQLGSDR
jgi:hypothetical protein